MNIMKHNITHGHQKTSSGSKSFFFFFTFDFLDLYKTTGHGDLFSSGQTDPESHEIQMLLVMHNKTLGELYMWCIPFILHPYM